MHRTWGVDVALRPPQAVAHERGSPPESAFLGDALQAENPPAPPRALEWPRSPGGSPGRNAFVLGRRRSIEPRRTHEELRAALQSSRAVSVDDAELRDGLLALHAHAADLKIFGDACEGMVRITDADLRYGREVQLTPRRAPKATPLAPANTASSSAARSCVFCPPGIEGEPKLVWERFYITATPFPYVAPSGQHTVILSREHLPQHSSERLLGEMIRFQARISGSAPFTLHYNGLAGNSQPHLHWHAIRETLPLQRALDTGALPLEATPRAGVFTYDQGLYAGFLVRGTPQHVVASAMALIEDLERHPKTTLVDASGVQRGTYNLILLHPRERGEARLVIIPRRANNLRHDLGAFGAHAFGAFELGGILDVKSLELPPGYVTATERHVRETLVSPEELGLDLTERSPRTA